MSTPWLRDDEIDSLCHPLVQNAAKVRHFRDMGLVVTTRPNGRPVVLRESWEAMQRGIKSTEPTVNTTARGRVRPNSTGLIRQFSRR